MAAAFKRADNGFTNAYKMLEAEQQKNRNLEAENAKLREQVTRLQSDWESEKDYADQMEAKEKMAVAENAKLRELVLKNWCIALSEREALMVYGINPDGGVYIAALNDEIAIARDRMRELGLEES